LSIDASVIGAKYPESATDGEPADNDLIVAVSIYGIVWNDMKSFNIVEQT